MGFLDDFERRVPNGKLGTERCNVFGLYIACPSRKARVTEMIKACEREGKRPRWVNLRKAFLIGSANLQAYVSSALPRIQNLKQFAEEDPEEFLSRLQREKSKLENLASGTRKEHDVSAFLNDDAVIRTFYDGLTTQYREIKNEVMRKAISTNHIMAPISTLSDLTSFLSVEMAILKDNAGVDPSKISSRRVRGQESVSHNQVQFESDGEDSSPAFNAIRPSKRDPDREVFQEAHRTLKETLQKNTQIFDYEHDEEEAGADEETQRKRKRGDDIKPATSRSRPSKKQSKPLVTIEEVVDSSSEEDQPLAKKSSKRFKDPTQSAIMLATLQLLANMTPINGGSAKAQETPIRGHEANVPRQAAQDDGAPRRTSLGVTCFNCAERVSDLKEHTCAQKKAKIFTCAHCKIPLKATTLSALFKHMQQCAKRYCQKCKLDTHSFYFCPDFKCNDCNLFGHSRFMHRLKDGPSVALLEANSFQQART